MALLPKDTPGLEELLPRIAKVYDGEFLLTPDGWDAKYICQLIYHGFFPMATEIEDNTYMLLPKLHFERCVLEPTSVHISKKARKLSKRFRMTVNTAWDDVIKGIQEFTFTFAKADNWLCPELAEALRSIRELSVADSRRVEVHTVEIWDHESGKLVAGELGYSLGKIYTSMTGFYHPEFSGAGGVQLAALGRWLSKSGFGLWDLGMDMKYKRELGGGNIKRKNWIAKVIELRESYCPLPNVDQTIRDLLAPIRSAEKE